MSIRKDEKKSPYYQFDFKRNGQRFHGSTGIKTKRDAQRYEDNLKRDIALGVAGKTIVTLDAATEAFWQAKGSRDKAHATTLYQLANLNTIIGGARLASTIRTQDFTAFVGKRQAQGVSNASINRELGLARRVWKFLQANGYDVPLPGTPDAIVWAELFLEEPKERVRELTAAEEKRLFEHLSPDLATVAMFAMLSGQRKSAVVGLRWDQVDFDGMRATIVNKGGDPHTFPLTHQMAALLNDRPRVDGCPFVFTYVCRRPSPKRKDREHRQKGVRYPYSAQGWNREWRTALAKAEVTDFRFHDLRHTTATRLLRSSNNLKMAQRLLGHTSITTTSRYAHVMEDDLRKGMAATELRDGYGKRLRRRRGSATKTAENDGIG